jgi:hypothetical protein
MQPRTRLSVAATALLFAACVDARDPLSPGVNQPPPPPPALGVGTWALSQADGQPLPAYVAHRDVDGRFEQVWVDSAFIDIREDGTWSQRIFTRNYLDGELQWRTTWVDQGRSVVDGGRYRFTSYSGMRSADVDNRLEGDLEVVEKMVSWPGSGLVAARYVPYVEPPVPGDPELGTGSFRARLTEKGPLSTPVYWFPDEPAPGAATMFLLDSAVLALRPDSTYVRRTFYSEWQAPQYREGGAFTFMARYVDFDRGRYLRDGDAITFSSDWIQNQALTGVVLSDGGVRIVQALSPGDPTFTVDYGRQ